MEKSDNRRDSLLLGATLLPLLLACAPTITTTEPIAETPPTATETQNPGCSSDADCDEGFCVFEVCAPCQSFGPVAVTPSEVALASPEKAKPLLERHADCVKKSGEGITLVIECSSDGKGTEAEQIAMANERGALLEGMLVASGVSEQRLSLAPTDRWLPASDDHCRFKWQAQSPQPQQ